MRRWLPWRDALAVVVVLGSIGAGVAVWIDGRVVVGLELETVDDGLSPYPGRTVQVSTVVPDGNAVRYGIHPGMLVADLRTTDGSDVARSRETVTAGTGESFRMPVEAVAPERIAAVTAGYVWGEPPDDIVIELTSQIDRDWLEARLQTDIYLVWLGGAVGLAVWGLLHQGLAGWIGRREAVTTAGAVAIPFVLAPVIDVGSPVGIVLTYAAGIAVSLLVGVGLAATHSDPAYRRAAVGAALAATALAALLIWRHMTTPLLSPDERGPMFTAIGAVAIAPAVVVSFGSQSPALRDRLSVLLIGLVPLAAMTLFLPSFMAPPLPLLLVAVLLGWHVVPWSRLAEIVSAGFARMRSGAATVADGPMGAPGARDRRDVLTGGLVGLVAAMTLSHDGAWALVLGVLAGGAVALGVRYGVLGSGWRDAAMPLGAAVGVPIMLVPFTWASYGASPPVILAGALATVGVAHVLAERHTDPMWRTRLFLGAVAVALFAVFVSIGSADLSVVLVGIVTLIPGVPVAFAERPGAQAISWRLEALAVALTPGAAATVLLPGAPGVLLLGGWLAVMIAWRYVGIVPLVGLANRTQLQRDLAVAAAETERARLAADLHDDALQQLTMLVRRLDDAGQNEAADAAREVATKLRSVVGDLRLPILDDLGAGAALEWLVERVEPLAGGPVKLERSDATRPPANVELAVFRVAQEALNNAIKHGRAPISVRYDVRSDGRVTLAVDDAGEGIGPDAAEEAPRSGHFGLANMQQRAEQIGALLDVRRWPAGGTRVALEWRPQ